MADPKDSTAIKAGDADWRAGMIPIPEQVLSKWKKNQKQILICVISVFVWGLTAHAYGFFSGAISHDSLIEFMGADEWKISIGRVFAPAYRAIFHAGPTMTWLVGVLSLLYICIAVFLVSKIFDIQNAAAMVLAAGIFTVNQTVTVLASTYIQDLDCDMMALLLSVAAVYLWYRFPRKGFLYGIIPAVLALGLYQSYISVTITLVFLYLIIRLLKGDCFKPVFFRGLKAVLMLVASGIIYLICTKVICFVTGILPASENHFNSISTITTFTGSDFIYNAAKGYLKACYQMVAPVTMHAQAVIIAFHVIMILIGIYLILVRWIRIRPKEKLLSLLLIIFLPLAMNVSEILCGTSHDLMYYAIAMEYLFVLLLVLQTCRRNAITANPEMKTEPAISGSTKNRQYFQSGAQIMVLILVCLILGNSVQTANAAYQKKAFEYDATLSFFTRVVYQMETVEGYTAGETPVVFAGDIGEQFDKIEGFDAIYELTGQEYTHSLGAAERGYYQAYFDIVLLNTAVMADSEVWSSMQTDAQVEAMPVYPAEGSIRIVDGVLVIKLSE